MTGLMNNFGGYFKMSRCLRKEAATMNKIGKADHMKMNNVIKSRAIPFMSLTSIVFIFHPLLDMRFCIL